MRAELSISRALQHLLGPLRRHEVRRGADVRKPKLRATSDRDQLFVARVVLGQHVVKELARVRERPFCRRPVCLDDQRRRLRPIDDIPRVHVSHVDSGHWLASGNARQLRNYRHHMLRHEPEFAERWCPLVVEILRGDHQCRNAVGGRAHLEDLYAESGQTLQGSFSAVSKPNFVIKYSLESSRRDLHNALLCTVLESICENRGTVL